MARSKQTRGSRISWNLIQAISWPLFFLEINSRTPLDLISGHVSPLILQINLLREVVITNSE